MRAGIRSLGNQLTCPKPSDDVHGTLGEAYMKSGDKQNAIKNYQKSPDLDPGNKSAREMLKKLESQ